MKYLFLVIAVACLALFLVAGYFAADQVLTAPSAEVAPGAEVRHAFERQGSSGPSLWTVVQNVSAVAGIVSFLVQIVQWRRHRHS